MKSGLKKIVTAVLISVVVAVIVTTSVNVSIGEALGHIIAKNWCEERGCSNIAEINDARIVLEGVVVLGAFFFVVASMIVSPEYRYYSALLGVVIIVLSGAAPPQALIEGVEWKLIMFLIGSMALAYLLQQLGTFRYLSVKILQISKGNPKLLVLYVSILSWFLSMVVGEVTSIIYMVMLILDIYKLSNYEIRPLLILSVIATNVGSLALPVGNPIGLYLAFTAGLTITDFLRMGLPLSFTTLLITIALFLILTRNYLQDFRKALSLSRSQTFVQSYYINLTERDLKNIYMGISILTAFLLTIAMNDLIAERISYLALTTVSPHAMLSFIPYVYLTIVAAYERLSSLREVLERGIEWPSIVFFISLFMIGYSLMWSGASYRIAYLTTKTEFIIGGLNSITPLYLLLSAVLSSILDNLSVVVAFTSIAKALVAAGIPYKIFWGILYGGVLGGNYTPIGSTANLVALAMTEKYMKITWGDWIKIAGLVTTVQVITALAWIFLTT